MASAEREVQLESVVRQVAGKACEAGSPGGKDCGCCLPCQARKALGQPRDLRCQPDFCESCVDRELQDVAYLRSKRAPNVAG